jgi:hypothetical protein
MRYENGIAYAQEDGQWVLADQAYEDRKVARRGYSGRGFIVGKPYPNMHGVPREKLWRHLTEGQRVGFVAQPDNPYDPNAVLVYREGDTANDIGMLDKNTAAGISKYLGWGMRFESSIWSASKEPGEELTAIGIDIRTERPRETEKWASYAQSGPRKGTQYKVNCAGEASKYGESKKLWAGLKMGDQVDLVFEGDTFFHHDVLGIWQHGRQLGVARGNYQGRVTTWVASGYPMLGTVLEATDLTRKHSSIVVACHL